VFGTLGLVGKRIEQDVCVVVYRWVGLCTIMCAPIIIIIANHSTPLIIIHVQHRSNPTCVTPPLIVQHHRRVVGCGSVYTWCCIHHVSIYHHHHHVSSLSSSSILYPVDLPNVESAIIHPVLSWLECVEYSHDSDVSINHHHHHQLLSHYHAHLVTNLAHPLCTLTKN